MSKKIGITLRIVQAQNYDETRDAISHEWVPFLEKIEYMPIFIPNNLTDIKSFLKNENFNGFILSGGDNKGDHPLRDNTENQIIEFGIKNNIPIFGVCRGMQVLNEYFDGKVQKNVTNSHVGKSHHIAIKKNFSKMLGDSITVNSFHHNLISEKELGRELESFAITKDDNTVEGLLHKNHQILGVMWHPEREDKEHDKILMKYFFQKKNH